MGGEKLLNFFAVPPLFFFEFVVIFLWASVPMFTLVVVL